MSCGIFEVMSASKKLSAELAQFEADLIARLRGADGRMFKDVEDYYSTESVGHDIHAWVTSGSTYSIPINLREPGKKGKHRARTLSVRLDMHRESNGEHSWVHASDALILVAFWPHRDESWENDELIVSAQGRLMDDDTWDACSKNIHAGGRLLEWREADEIETRWSHRAWLFGIPMKKLTSSDSVEQQIVRPVVKLLGGIAPEGSLTETDAIQWTID